MGDPSGTRTLFLRQVTFPTCLFDPLEIWPGGPGKSLQPPASCRVFRSPHSGGRRLQKHHQQFSCLFFVHPRSRGTLAGRVPMQRTLSQDASLLSREMPSSGVAASSSTHTHTHILTAGLLRRMCQTCAIHLWDARKMAQTQVAETLGPTWLNVWDLRAQNRSVWGALRAQV